MQTYFFCLILFLTFNLSSLEAQSIAFDKIYKSKDYMPEKVNGFNFLKDGQHYREYLPEKGLVKKAILTGGEVEVIVRSGEVLDENKKALSLDDVVFNAEEDKMLVFVSRESIYRRSSKAKVFLYDLKTKQCHLIAKEKILHASFSPKSDYIAFVLDNNLYVYDIAKKTSKAITQDGKKNQIINGNCDWVYEEEFSFTQAYQWSEEGSYIAYYKFNETQVKEYTIPLYTKSENYPLMYTYKYPRAGELNSKVSIWIYDVKTNKQQAIKISDDEDIYVPRIVWSKSDKDIVVYKLNRLQNELDLLSYNVSTKNINLLYKETSSSYVEAENNLHFLQDKKSFLFVSEKGAYRSIYQSSIQNPQAVRLTNDSCDVDDLLGMDEVNQQLYRTTATVSMD